MGNGYDLNAVVYQPIDQLEGKAMKDVTASPMLEERPSVQGLVK